MDVKEYLQNPCGTLSIPYWKAKTLAIPDSMRIIHCSNWNGQYGNFQRFFRIKHDLNDLSPIDYDYDTLSIDYQATQLCEMINESYKHENKEQGIGGNRHDPEKYAQDPEVQILAIADETDTVRGILTGYALHPTVLPTDTTLASTDYVGYLRRTVEQAYPGAVFGFMQGCSGNQSSRYYRHEQSYREAERFGSTIGGEAVRVLKGLTFHPVRTPLAAKRIWYAPSHMCRIPPYAEAKETAEKARVDYEALVNQNAPEADCRSAECTKIGTEIMLVYARDAEKYGTEAVLATNTPIELHVVQLGGMAIASVAAEVFVEVGLAVKKTSPFAMTMLSCLTGGSSQSYICSHYAYEAMYYEPSESLYGEGTAEELTAVLETELQKLDQEGAAAETR